MKALETGKDKIEKICEALKKETLDPARQEAREIVENAHLQAAEVLTDAKREAEEILLTADKEMEEKKKVFHASLQLSCRQGVEELKQKIEQELFNKELIQIIQKEMADPKLISGLIQSLIQAMEEKGIEEEFVAVIPKHISSRSISSLLAAKILDKLQSQIVSIGDFRGGVQIALKGRNLTIDVSDTAIRELVGKYIRKDFRDLVFAV